MNKVNLNEKGCVVCYIICYIWNQIIIINCTYYLIWAESSNLYENHKYTRAFIIILYFFLLLLNPTPRKAIKKLI